MANFLERLLARSQNSSPVVRPQLAPVFGPQLPTFQPEPQFANAVETETPTLARPHSISLSRDQTHRHPETLTHVSPSPEFSRRQDPSKSTASPTASEIDTQAFATGPQPQASHRVHAVFRDLTDDVIRYQPEVVSPAQ